MTGESHMVEHSRMSALASGGRTAAALVGAVVLVMVACFGGHRANLLNYALPAMATIVAAQLFRINKAHYVRFMLAIWYFIPLIRRLIDYDSGFSRQSPVLLTAYLVTLVGSLMLLPRMVTAPLSRSGPFILASAGIGLAACYGLFNNPITGVIIGLLLWWPQIGLGWLVSVDRESASEYWLGLRSSIPVLTALLAAYTLVQFAVVFPWDSAWVINMDIPSMSNADPFSIRAFGTLNSAGTCAFALAFGSLFVIIRESRWRIPVLLLSVPALVTTQIRAGWVLFAIGLVVSILYRTRNTLKILVPIMAVAMLGMFAGIQTSSSIASLSDRFNTLNDGMNDSSANSRMDGYEAAIEAAKGHPLGFGLGVSEGVFDIAGSFSLRDSGVVDLIISLGWFGAAAYLCGIGAILLPLLRAAIQCKDDSTPFSLAIPTLALLSVLPLGSVIVSLPGVLIWLASATGRVLIELESAESDGLLLPANTSTVYFRGHASPIHGTFGD